MAIAFLFALTVVAAGYATLRILGVAKGALGFGLAPAAGVAVLSIIASWSVLLGAPPPLPGLMVVVAALPGVVLMMADHRPPGTTLWRDQRVPVVVLGVALTVPFIAMGIAFGSAEVPLSPHDGASHTEAIQAYRSGLAWANWYPPGLPTLFAAWLQALPWIDSAQGAVDLGMSLPPLAALAVFGLGVAVWRDLRIAAAGALLLGFTYLYPYFPQIWSGWPLAMSLVLVMGVWTVGLEYVNRPSWRLALLGGLMLGAIVLIHGSELYTLAVLLPAVLVSAWRRVVWLDLAQDLGLAVVVGVVCAAVYLPNLFQWAGVGGAYAVGLQDGGVAAGSFSRNLDPNSNPFTVFGLGALGIDLPLRLLLLGIGTVWAFRHCTGRSVVVLALLFTAITSALTFLNGITVLRQIYALTFPWGMHYRMFMLVTIGQVLLAAAGGVVFLRWVFAFASRPSAWARRLGRLTRLSVVTWVILMTWATAVFLVYPARLVLGYTADDARAMAWLDSTAPPGSVVLNDGYADAGIWAPYKTGLPIVLTRSASAEEVSRGLLLIDNVAHLDHVPDACGAHIEYVYRGARASAWDARRFPSLDALRASPALEEVFASGDAVVFRTKLPCLPVN
jgi:Family of unknown function (DUF6541)